MRTEPKGSELINLNQIIFNSAAVAITYNFTATERARSISLARSIDAHESKITTTIVCVCVRACLF